MYCTLCRGGIPYFPSNLIYSPLLYSPLLYSTLLYCPVHKCHTSSNCSTYRVAIYSGCRTDVVVYVCIECKAPGARLTACICRIEFSNHRGLLLMSKTRARRGRRVGSERHRPKKGKRKRGCRTGRKGVLTLYLPNTYTYRTYLVNRLISHHFHFGSITTTYF